MPAQQPVSETVAAAEAAAPPGLIVVSVVAEPGYVFAGEALARALHNNRLRYGDQNIYHRALYVGHREQPVFSVANLVKPGTFPSDGMHDFETPGVTLFLPLPAPIDNLEAFDDFVTTAERLAVELGGELRDEQHSLLSHQRLMQVRSSVESGHLQAASGPA